MSGGNQQQLQGTNGGNNMAFPVQNNNMGLSSSSSGGAQNNDEAKNMQNVTLLMRTLGTRAFTAGEATRLARTSGGLKRTAEEAALDNVIKLGNVFMRGIDKAGAKLRKLEHKATIAPIVAQRARAVFTEFHQPMNIATSFDQFLGAALVAATQQPLPQEAKTTRRRGRPSNDERAASRAQSSASAPPAQAAPVPSARDERATARNNAAAVVGVQQQPQPPQQPGDGKDAAVEPQDSKEDAPQVELSEGDTQFVQYAPMYDGTADMQCPVCEDPCRGALMVEPHRDYVGNHLTKCTHYMHAVCLGTLIDKQLELRWERDNMSTRDWWARYPGGMARPKLINCPVCRDTWFDLDKPGRVMPARTGQLKPRDPPSSSSSSSSAAAAPHASSNSPAANSPSPSSGLAAMDLSGDNSPRSPEGPIG